MRTTTEVSPCNITVRNSMIVDFRPGRNVINQTTWGMFTFLGAPMRNRRLLRSIFFVSQREHRIVWYAWQQKHRIGTISNIKLLGWGLQPVLHAPNLTLSFCSGSKHLDSCFGPFGETVISHHGHKNKLSH